ncbi:MAG: hypothetical protein RIQ88_949 [Actinomycetota bacterium]|jgi:uncharacterized membrane protein HdeD (DUF308 family)
MKCKNCTATIENANTVCSTCGYQNRDTAKPLDQTGTGFLITGAIALVIGIVLLIIGNGPVDSSHPSTSSLVNFLYVLGGWAMNLAGIVGLVIGVILKSIASAKKTK